MSRLMKVGIATVVVLLCIVQVQAETFKPAVKPLQTDGYAEGIYAEHENASGTAILFDIQTVTSGKLTDIAGLPFGELIDTPNHRVEAIQNGSVIKDPRFLGPEGNAYADSYLASTVEDLEILGYPVALGQYRMLQVDVAIGGEIKQHQALEICWPSLGRCVMIDPVVLFVESMAGLIKPHPMPSEMPLLLLELMSLDNPSFSEGRLCFEMHGNEGIPISTKATCSGYGCDNTDPSSTGCATGAYSVGSVAYNATRTQWVELRYSPTCGTNWARSGSSSAMSHYVRIQRYSPSATITNGPYYGYGAYSNQLYCPTPCLARACASSNGSTYFCTGWY